MACVGPSLRWAAVCVLSVLVCVCVRAQDECVDRDARVREMDLDATLPSGCVLSCTALTYRRVLEEQKRITVRFRDPQIGASGEFCWFIRDRCSTWDEAFVVLSVSESDPSGEMIRLQIDSSTPSDVIPPHESPSVLPDACGLRFDVSPFMRRPLALCVTPHGIMGNELPCPPFLVIIRRHRQTLH